MIKDFNKFAGFKVLNYFLENPSSEIHIKGLSRTLNISSSTAKYYCDLYKKENILNLEKKANLNLFSLNNNNIYVNELKKTFSLLNLKEHKIENISKNSISIAIYGSFASGEYINKSDLDILIIGKSSQVDKNLTIKLQKKLKREIQLTIIDYPKWENMKKQKDVFALEVLNNHILLRGTKL